MKNLDIMQVYQSEMLDMVERGVVRKLSELEMRDYRGPVYYISHHEVLKPSSLTTPCRIVFNSSSNYRGHILNDYWAKGSSLINNLQGILLRFRENFVGVVGDIKKMYHSIQLSNMDQHTHTPLSLEKL